MLSQRRSGVLMVGAVVAACAAGALTDVPADAQRLAFDPIEELQTPSSAFTQSQRLVIVDDETWSDVWNQFHGARVPKPAVPEIDFSQRMIFLAAMGQRGSGGYSITVEGVYRDDDRLLIEVVETSPGPMCVNSAVVTSPATAVIADRWDGDLAWVEKRRETEC